MIVMNALGVILLQSRADYCLEWIINLKARMINDIYLFVTSL